jgi:hypothetical protein
MFCISVVFWNTTVAIHPVFSRLIVSIRWVFPNLMRLSADGLPDISGSRVDQSDALSHGFSAERRSIRITSSNGSHKFPIYPLVKTNMLLWKITMFNG